MEVQVLSRPNYAPVAQLAEQDTLNVKVGGSIPPWRSLLLLKFFSLPADTNPGVIQNAVIYSGGAKGAL